MFELIIKIEHKKDMTEQAFVGLTEFDSLMDLTVFVEEFSSMMSLGNYEEEYTYTIRKVE